MMQNLGQFRGLPIEDPLTYLKVLEWLITLSDGVISTWDECTHKFLLKYFLPSKYNKLKKDIMNFS
ncbi:hypothetical protein CR513_13267, partial [Mucuna pruriens]